MSKLIETLSLNYIKALSEDEKLYYVDENIFITMNAEDFGTKFLRYGQPYRVNEGRIMLVTSGYVRVIINLEEHCIEKQSVMIIVPDSVFEIIEWSPDFNQQAITFKDIPVFNLLNPKYILHLDDSEWRLLLEYMAIIWYELRYQHPVHDVITHLQTAMLLELKRFAEREEAKDPYHNTRREKIYMNFLSLVTQFGRRERKIEFYADKLCVTPNHLGAIIKNTTGLTVMQLLNRYLIQQAKVLLRYSDLSIYEVSEKMNFANPSFFTKFFKKETGMTPKEYRMQK